MRIILSPAKRMKVDTDSLPYHTLPAFLPMTEQLVERLQGMTDGELKRLWNCNDQIAAANIERLRQMDLRRNLTPAILSYVGIQYQYMAPGVFTQAEYDYVEEHLRILSGFYGILRPFDGVTPYRLEMGAKLSVGKVKDLYEYWGNRIAEELFQETDCVVDLASREYSRCVSLHLRPQVRFLTCVFGERKDGKVIEKGTLCKMARGEMVRWMAREQVENIEKLKSFTGLGYQFCESDSSENTWVFVKG